MADQKLPKDELEALRWFRQRLRHLAREHPALKTTKHQERLSAYLTQQALEEQETCPESPQETPEADPQEPDSSTTVPRAALPGRVAAAAQRVRSQLDIGLRRGTGYRQRYGP